LHLTHPRVFALRQNAAFFECFVAELRKFRTSKKPTVGFFSRCRAIGAAPQIVDQINGFRRLAESFGQLFENA